MTDREEPAGRGETWDDDAAGNAWFATEHAHLLWKRWRRTQRGELPEVTIMCAGGGRHREKRLGNGNAHGCWPSRASKSGQDAVGIHVSDDSTKTVTLDPCPVRECGKHVTITRENWQKVYAFCMLTGRTKFDVTLLPF